MGETLELLWTLRYGVAVLVLVGAACGALGVHAVAQRMATWGLALPQAAAFGAAVGYVVLLEFGAGGQVSLHDPSPTVWGLSLVAQLIAVVLLVWPPAIRTLGAAGVACAVFAVAVAGASLLLSGTPAGQDALSRWQGGDALLAGGDDVLLVSLCLAAPLAFVFLARRRLTWISVAPTETAALGLRPRVWRAAFGAALVLVVLTSVHAAGTLVVLASLLFAGATGLLLGRGPTTIVCLGAGAGAVSSLAGSAIACSPLDLPAGAACAMTAALLFVVVGACLRAVRRPPDRRATA